MLAAPDAVVSQAGGRLRVDSATLRDAVVALRPIVEDVVRRRPRPRPERLSGVHNPWGHAATIGHAWRFLDVCEHPAIVDAVARLIGDDVILWDAELHLEAAPYRRFVESGGEGRYWPAEPLAGAVVLVAPLQPERLARALDLQALGSCDVAEADPGAPLLVIRYQPATSRFERDPRAPRHRALMQDNPLVNYANRPLWLVRGEDRAGNDFVTGFSPPAPRWAAAPKEKP